MSETAPTPPTPPSDKPAPVGFLARLGFAFLLLYLVLYGLPFPVSEVPAQEDAWVAADADVVGLEVGKYANKWLDEVTEEVHWLVEQTGEVAGYENVEYAQTGSGDGLYNYLRVALFLLGSLLLAPLLAFAIRGRRLIGVLHGLLRVYVRYALASAMCVYGFYKVFPLQFPALAGERLYGTYGDASPMNMLWSFMGASESFTVFAGLAEVLGGVLLLFRRTTMFGALVALAVMTHVLLLNLCYDVPVKLFSLHMVLYAAFLLGGDGPRLWAFFFSHQAVAAPRLRMAVPKWLLVPWFVIKLAAGAAIVAVPLTRAWTMWDMQQEQPSGPLAGIWEAREFTSNAPAGEHWHHLTIQYWSFGERSGSAAAIHKLSRESIQSMVTVDPEAKTLTMPRGEQPAIELQYEERSQLIEGSDEPRRQLVVTGTLDGHDLHAVLEHRDESTFRLKRMDFRWVQERPWNVNRK